jgi:8-oxo-dGTP diphosphatase
MKKIEVVAAIFKNSENEYYCARRKPGGELSMKWEFPGGKIEAGESHKQALTREIKEELKLDIKVGEHCLTVEHQYSSFHLTMHAYFATITGGELTLTEHTGQKWLAKEELLSLDWAAADVPIVQKLIK